MTKKPKKKDQILLDQEDLEKLTQAPQEIEELVKVQEARIAELEVALEKRETELELAKQYLCLPTAVEIERIGTRTRVRCAHSGLELRAFSKMKTELGSGKDATATITFDAHIQKIEFTKPQLDLLPTAPEGEGEEEQSEESQALAN